ncbi:hypothetical protein PAHAL_5G263300 [Panicum hallii]|uniref:Uncharacterized protein n=1 Tax=Panicum hallii TaxID=206008 RepID=A0A2T8ILA0_9POAL|nr:hypothetical protein PAHAL_5G263300 [Panicum hallii]
MCKTLLYRKQTLALSLIYHVHDFYLALSLIYHVHDFYYPPPWVWLDLLSTYVLTLA